MTQAVAGPGGIGKTQIVVEFAYRHRKRYRAVFWVRADTETSLVSGYRELAKVLGYHELAKVRKSAGNSHEVVADVCRWLGREPGYLLILDNADDPVLVKPYLPPDPRGHVLLTSRAHTFDALGIRKPIALPVLEPNEALAFLGKRTGREGPLDSAEQAAARTLTGELGYLPLALEQAAAYMKEHEETFSVYLDAHHTLRLKLLNEMGPVAGEYPETVRATWKRSFDAVAKASPASIALLRLSAFFAPDAIPYELILEGTAVFGELLASALASSPGGEYGPSRSKRTKTNANNVIRNNLSNYPLSRWFLCEGYFVPSPKPEAGYALNRLLAPLARHSLVRRNPKARTYSIHHLVQAVMRDELAAADRKEIAERAIKALSWTFPFDGDSRSERLVSHALAAQGWIESEDLRTPEAARLLHRAGYYLELHARYAEAEPLFRRALAIREATLGPDHTDTSATRRHVRQPQQSATVLQAPGPARGGGAVAALSPEHLRTVTCQKNLAMPRPIGTKRGRLMSVNWWIEKGTRLLSRFVHGDSTS